MEISELRDLLKIYDAHGLEYAIRWLNRKAQEEYEEECLIDDLNAAAVVDPEGKHGG